MWNAKRKSRRAHFTKSKLRAPESPIYSLAAEFQNYMHLPDPTPLYALMGGVAGNMLNGYPLWLMLVGNSGSGKTMLLKSLGNLKHTRRESSISGEAALLSGVKKKEQARDATGGLLREMQWGTKAGFGCLVFLDFTSILSMPQKEMTTMLGAFREIHDGAWSRKIGGEGGRSLEWEGKIASMAGVTHVIDNYHEVIKTMGERFLYFRFPQTDGYAESKAAANEREPEENDEARKVLVAGMFESLGMSFETPKARRELKAGETDRIVGLAQFGSKTRSPVIRDRYYKNEVMNVLTPEVSTRMTVGLVQLYLGCEEIGLDEEDRWKVLERVAFDSIPLTRGVVLNAVLTPRDKGNGWQTGELLKMVTCGQTSVGVELDNLKLLGVIRKSEKGWEATEWTRERIGRREAITRSAATS